MRWSLGPDGRHWRLVQPVAPAPVPIDDMTTNGSTVKVGALPDPLGYVVLDVSLERLTRVRDNMLMLGAAVILVAILLSVALMAWLARGVIRPLSRIIAGVEAMGRGELDTRIEGVRGDVFQRLANVINKMAEGVKMTQAELQQRIEAATQEVREAKAKAEQEARLDPLTGLYNRRAFMELASGELLRARRYNSHLSIAMIDLDHFKKINDNWGHAIGDRVLVAFAGILKNSMREVDVIARLGGEEFVLLMTETTVEEATRVAERIRGDVVAGSLQLADAQLHWTASFGVTALHDDDYSVTAALLRADKALYKAKEGGRNRVEYEMKQADTPND
jgi:diguanylate cyclase (GGDEF)-like protein